MRSFSLQHDIQILLHPSLTSFDLKRYRPHMPVLFLVLQNLILPMLCLLRLFSDSIQIDKTIKVRWLFPPSIFRTLVTTSDCVFQRPIIIHFFKLLLDSILMFLLLCHGLHVILLDLLFPLAPLCCHDVLQDLVSYQVLYLTHVGRTDIFRPPKAQFFSQAVIVGDQ